MKSLPGILAVSLLFAAIHATSVSAQTDDGGGLVLMSAGGGGTFSNVGTVLNLDAGSIAGAETYAGSSTLTLSSGATYFNTINNLPLTGLQRFGSNTNNVPVLPTSLWPTLGSPTVLGGTLTSGGTVNLGIYSTPPSTITVLPYLGLNLGSTTLENGNGLGTIVATATGVLTLTSTNVFTATGLTLSYGNTNAVLQLGIGTNAITGGTLVFNGNNNVVGGVIELNGITQNGVIQPVDVGTLQLTGTPLIESGTNLQITAADLTPTPEPSAVVLLALGLAVPLWRARRRFAGA